MADVRFSYVRVRDHISIALKDYDDWDLITASFLGSHKTLSKHEFQKELKNLPDTVESQVKILSALLDDVSIRYAAAYKAVHGGNLTSGELESLRTAIERIRAAFTMSAFQANVLSVSHNGLKPLFDEFFLEQLGDQLPDAVLAGKILDTFFEAFKVKEAFYKNGSVEKILAIVIASM